nr:LuxR C-terminal-related transcriptional regulator [Aneurinibacillus danicus]
MEIDKLPLLCVSKHVRNVMQKLNVKGRSQAVVELVRLGELKI